MDFFAHGLWAGAAGAMANRKLKTRVRLACVVCWGVFPDVFAFGPVVAALLWFRFFEQPLSWRLLFSRAVREALPAFLRPDQLYHLSHSLVVFLVVFALVWMLSRRPVLTMLAWPLHILIDIPTHGAGTFSTPFLWPVSSYRFHGLWWSQPWFMILNYTSIAAVYVALLILSLASKQKLTRDRPAQLDRVCDRQPRNP